LHALRVRFKFSLLLIPLLGGLFGYAWAFVFMHGLHVPWRFVGKPADKIFKIIGFVGGPNLFVETDSGDIYSLAYYNPSYGKLSLSFPVVWNKEENRIFEPTPTRKSYADFISLPLLFKTKQIYEMVFPMIEGNQLVKFALSEDGNLWVWEYAVGGFSGFSYIIFPIIGVIFGSILSLLIRIGIFITGKIRSKPA
jgi:hypothetical protein